MYSGPQQPWPPQSKQTGYGEAPQGDELVVVYNLDFTGRAFLALYLYMLGYVPGLVLNIVYLNQAQRVRRETGREPLGYGCLVALLVAGIGFPLSIVCMICLLVVLAVTGNL